MRVALYEVIIEALRTLGGERHYSEIDEWIIAKYGQRWKSCKTELADMVHPEKGGNKNTSSRHSIERRILSRRGDGIYCL
ncbi:hypothetical protein HQN89_02255 [Paenibacillus frigoriresistens]|uniref:hypothetical protein n=1 Tax=Paenibacillus alginolyticus TaxID=59839 RepID=UPI001563A0D8|nr:hypothetical protein [Paenibacillus frigoriresistens]NRF89862.1 hypothetical protein [Paenibacillus frigoriresistens]